MKPRRIEFAATKTKSASADSNQIQAISSKQTTHWLSGVAASLHLERSRTVKSFLEIASALQLATAGFVPVAAVFNRDQPPHIS